jgi:hypothetical protein
MVIAILMWSFGHRNLALLVLHHYAKLNLHMRLV